MSVTRTEIDVDEKNTAPATATFTSDGSTAIPLANIDSMTMTLIDEVSGNVINSRNAQNVLNANNCTYHATNGTFTWNWQSADVAIQGDNVPVNRRENHLATITVVFDTSKQKTFEILLMCKNLRGVT